MKFNMAVMYINMVVIIGFLDLNLVGIKLDFVFLAYLDQKL